MELADAESYPAEMNKRQEVKPKREVVSMTEASRLYWPFFALIKSKSEYSIEQSEMNAQSNGT